MLGLINTGRKKDKFRLGGAQRGSEGGDKLSIIYFLILYNIL